MNTDHNLEQITKLEEVLEEFQFVNDFMPQMVWATRPDGYHYFYNKRWYEFTGLTYEETKNTGWSKVLHPDDYNRTWQVWKESLETGNSYQIEYRMRKFDGSYNWFLARAYPLKDDKGKIIKWFGTCTDIQDQRQILDELSATKEKLNAANEELRNKNNQLQRINIELDNFVYVASHDLKAPLSNIEGLIRLLDSPGVDLAKQKKMMTMINESLTRFKSIVNDLSAIAKSTKNSEEVEKVNLDKLLTETEEDLKDMVISSGASLTRKLEVSWLRYSKKDIRSILFNLISNAIKYRSPDRTPQIQVRSKKVNDYVVLEVEDNGLGINQNDVPKLFQKYSRLHNQVEGTGIGLFILKRMVENANGKIELKSKEGNGSLFKVSLQMKGNG